ncbi:hypothetical protein TNCV_4395771 [Trichonephila clavipes]|uniref:Uncharacterized protein n=1 Tax=Trichonephila clavipes TaxID=2585209 RepID=A0A8X6W4V2_TRICX|nr:hypothetical protein TNCV_4395771 [Trichonephila clavipes]
MNKEDSHTEKKCGTGRYARIAHHQPQLTALNFSLSTVCLGFVDFSKLRFLQPVLAFRFKVRVIVDAQECRLSDGRIEVGRAVNLEFSKWAKIFFDKDEGAKEHRLSDVVHENDAIDLSRLLVEDGTVLEIRDRWPRLG